MPNEQTTGATFIDGGLVSAVLRSWIADARRIAVIGLSKNSGKTTGLIKLLSQVNSIGLTAGILSTGLDGETSDFLHGHRKPAVSVPSGTFVVTSLAELERVGQAAIVTRLALLGVATGLKVTTPAD